MKRLIRKADAEIDTTDYLSCLDKVDDAVKDLWEASSVIKDESDTLDFLPKSYFDSTNAHNNTVEANFYNLAEQLRTAIGKIESLSKDIRGKLDVK